MFIDAKDKDVKHAFAAMFVEILVPVAASANRELNVPALKNFVDMTYHHAIDMVRKNKHSHVSLFIISCEPCSFSSCLAYMCR